jgi:hypothetical protein
VIDACTLAGKIRRANLALEDRLLRTLARP